MRKGGARAKPLKCNNLKYYHAKNVESGSDSGSAAGIVLSVMVAPEEMGRPSIGRPIKNGQLSRNISI
jgi:hypothetical protein